MQYEKTSTQNLTHKWEELTSIIQATIFTNRMN